MTTDNVRTERPVTPVSAGGSRCLAARHEGARRGLGPHRPGAGRASALVVLFSLLNAVVLPARQFRRHRRQLDFDPDCRARHLGAC